LASANFSPAKENKPNERQNKMQLHKLKAAAYRASLLVQDLRDAASEINPDDALKKLNPTEYKLAMIAWGIVVSQIERASINSAELSRLVSNLEA